MKKLCKIIFFFLIFTIYAEGQPVTWQKLYSDEPSFSEGYSSVQLYDEGYIVIGSKVPNNGLDIIAMRLDKFGNLIWRKFYEGNNPQTIVKTNDGNFLIGANVLTKIDINGDLIWRRPNAPSYRINLANDGGYYYCGAKEVSPLHSVPSIKKYDSLGFLSWEKSYENHLYRGGFSNCIINQHGKLVLIGSFSPGDTIYDLPFIMQTDTFGNFIWVHKYGYDSLRYFYLNNIVENVQSYYMVSGSNSLCYLVKFDSLGNWVWVRYYESSFKNPGSFDYLIKTKENDLVFTGYLNVGSYYFVRLLKTDYDGNKEWTKLYGVGQYATGNFVNRTIDGGFIIIGRRDTFNQAQIYAIKTDEKGNTSPYVNIEMITEVVQEDFTLFQNYPNPFNPKTKITFDLLKKSQVDLAVYNVKGQKISKLLSQGLNPGRYSLDFNIDNLDLTLPTGIYFYSLKAGSQIKTCKMILIK